MGFYLFWFTATAIKVDNKLKKQQYCTYWTKTAIVHLQNQNNKIAPNEQKTDILHLLNKISNIAPTEQKQQYCTNWNKNSNIPLTEQKQQYSLEDSNISCIRAIFLFNPNI